MASEATHSESDRQTKQLLLIVFVLWLAGLILPPMWFGGGESAGQFGDMFGAVNALFSGLAFAVIYVTLKLQREELKLQRNEMRLMREQYERTAKSQEESEKILNNQVEATIQSARIQGFTTLVDLHLAVRTRGVTLEESLGPYAGSFKDAITGIQQSLIATEKFTDSTLAVNKHKAYYCRYRRYLGSQSVALAQ